MREEDGGVVALHPDIESQSVAVRLGEQRPAPRRVERGPDLVVSIAQIDARPLVPEQAASEHERLDFSTVPQSKGIGKTALVIVFTGLLGIFIMGFLSVIMSGYGHMWPAPKTMRMDLGNMPSKNP